MTDDTVRVALSLPTLNINGSSELLIALMDTLKEVIAGVREAPRACLFY